MLECVLEGIVSRLNYYLINAQPQVSVKIIGLLFIWKMYRGVGQ